MPGVFTLRCESCGGLLKSLDYPLICNFCGAENWAKDKFSFSEQRAVANLRLLHGAEITFQATIGIGNYGTPEEIFRYGLIPKELAEALNTPKMQNEAGIYCEGTNKPLSGYCFQLQIFSASDGRSASFTALAIVDVKTYRQGKWNFYIDESGVIRFSQEPKIIPNKDSEIFDIELDQNNWK